MPELPDVEVFRRYFDSTSLGRRIESVDVRDMEVVETSARKLHEVLEGAEFDETERIGKHMFARCSDRGWLALHFGMTGRLSYYEHGEDEPDHVRLEIRFEDGGRLGWVNKRRLGRVDVTDDPVAYADEHGLGPDALEIEKIDFVEAVSGRGSAIKSVLMDQSVISGIGNVYADEILFQARIDPRARVEDLSDEDLGEIWRDMRRIMRVAIRHEADPSDFPKGYLLPAREAGASCPGDCGGDIDKTEVSGRPTYVCTSCQRRESG